MILSNLEGKKIVLASKSPRRQELLKGLGLNFEIRLKEVDETFPPHLMGGDIPLYLSALKAEAFKDEMKPNEIVITADTVVWVGDTVLNKPEDREQAIEMLELLSDKTHIVYTAVNIMSNGNSVRFVDETHVTFRVLSKEEIEHYVDFYKPFDKAGAYGVQEFIGFIAIKELKGSFYNVMGLPTHRVYEELKQF